MTLSRPLNAFERFFCDEPSRRYGEAKLLSVAGSLTIPSMALSAPCDEQAAEVRLKEAAMAAWASVAKHLPYIRCHIAYVDGAPQLVEVGQEEFVAKLPELSAVHVVQECGSTAEALECIRAVPFDETVVVATVALAVTSWDRGDVALMVTMSHVGADARGAFAAARVFVEDLGQWLRDGTTPDREPGRLVNLIEALGVERIVDSPLVLPSAGSGEALPPYVPSCPPCVASPPPNDQCKLTLKTTTVVIDLDITMRLLQLSKQYDFTMQSLFSAAGLVATLKRADKSIRDALAASPDRALIVGAQVTVQLRDIVQPPLPSSSILLGGSVFWVYVPVGYATTVLDLAQRLRDEITRGLSDRRVIGYFKLYLASPWEPPGTSDEQRLRSICQKQQDDTNKPTFNFTNVGMTELSHLGNVDSNVVMHNAELELRSANHVAPAYPYMRGHGHTFRGSFHLGVTYTEPCFTPAYAAAFVRDVADLATSLASVLEDKTTTEADGASGASQSSSSSVRTLPQLSHIIDGSSTA